MTTTPMHPHRTTAPQPSDPALFTARNLSVLHYTQGFTFWHYKHAESFLDISYTPAEFFKSALAELIKPGDIIMISCGNGALQYWVSPSSAMHVMSSCIASYDE